MSSDRSESGQHRRLGLDDAYSVQTPEDNRALYRDWAGSYESDFIEPRGYVYHRNVVELFARHHPSPAGPILDVGCGTGIVGAELTRLGFSTIDGLDLSPEMLNEARRKQIYRNLIEADLTQPLSLANRSYSGVLSVGTFTHGHVGPSALPELIRIASPGAAFALGINAEHYESHGFASAFEQMAEHGEIVSPTVEMVRIYEGADDEHADDVALTVIFQTA